MATVQLGQTEVILLQQLAEAYGVTGQLGQTEVVLLQQILAAILSGAGGGGGASLPSQTGNAGKVLGTDGTDALWQTIPPALPVWTYTAGVIGSGLFTTNNVNISSSTTITFDDGTFNGLFAHVTVGSIFFLTDSSGLCSAFEVSGNGGGGAFSVNNLGTQGALWSGAYQVSFAPTASLQEIFISAGVTPFTGTASPITSLTANIGIVEAAG